MIRTYQFGGSLTKALREGCFAEGCFAEGCFAEGRCAEGRCAEGRGAEGRCAEGASRRGALIQSLAVRLRDIRVGCFGGGTGIPSLLGGLKRNPWISPNAVVTMFDSGGSSGVLRDELGVLPPGDVVKGA